MAYPYLLWNDTKKSVAKRRRVFQDASLKILETQEKVVRNAKQKKNIVGMRTINTDNHMPAE